MEKKDRIKALIECPKNKFTKDDQSFLEGLSDERLKEFEEQNASPQQPSTPATPPAPPTSPAPTAPAGPATPSTPATPTAPPTSPKAKTVDEYVADAPEEIRQILDEGVRAAKARKAASIAALKAADKGKLYTDQELEAMPQRDLDRMLALAGTTVPPTAPVDYSTLIPRDAASNDQDRTAPPPPDLTAAIRKHRGLTN